MKQPPAWQFGAFTLVPTQRLLLEGQAPVRVGGRALDLLIVLVEAAGKVVDRGELMASVWKKVVVDEGSLRVHVAALRRALGDDGDTRRYIVNVPGRGYSFVGDVVPAVSAGVNGSWPKLDVKRSHLPPLLVNVVGRDDAVREVGAMVAEHRLVTVVGAGGVGKTTVALAAAAQIAAHYRDGARFVDLAPLRRWRGSPSPMTTYPMSPKSAGVSMASRWHSNSPQAGSPNWGFVACPRACKTDSWS